MKRLSFRAGLLFACALVAACGEAPDAESSERGSPLGDSTADLPLPALDLGRLSEPVVRTAVEERRAALLREPRSPDRWAALADLLRHIGWEAEAGACYREAERLQPREFRRPYAVAWSLLDVDPEASEQAFQRAIALDADYAVAHLGRAFALVDLGRLDEAIAEGRRALELSPNNPDVLLQLGRMELDANLLDDAATHLRRVAALTPENGEVHEALARLCFARGDTAGAAQHREQAREHPALFTLTDPRGFPPFPPLTSRDHREEAHRLSAENRLAEAVAEYRRALEIRADDPSSWRELGNLLARQEDFPGAEQAFLRALEFDPEDWDARARLGVVYSVTNRPQDAVRLLDQSLRIEPDQPQTWQELGTLLARGGNLEGAVQALGHAVEHDPELGESQALLAKTLAKLERPEEALEPARRAVALGAGGDATRSLLANLLRSRADQLLEKGLAREAIDLLEEARPLEPTSTATLRKLCWTLATHADPGVRDPARAVALAESLLEQSRGTESGVLDAAACAYAAAGDFVRAVDLGRRAAEAATQAGRTEQAERITERVRGFEARTPYRAPPVTSDDERAP